MTIFLQFLRKNDNFLSIFGHSNGNFPKGQIRSQLGLPQLKEKQKPRNTQQINKKDSRLYLYGSSNISKWLLIITKCRMSKHFCMTWPTVLEYVTVSINKLQNILFIQFVQFVLFCYSVKMMFSFLFIYIQAYSFFFFSVISFIHSLF